MAKVVVSSFWLTPFFPFPLFLPPVTHIRVEATSWTLEASAAPAAASPRNHSPRCVRSVSCVYVVFAFYVLPCMYTVGVHVLYSALSPCCDGSVCYVIVGALQMAASEVTSCTLRHT